MWLSSTPKGNAIESQVATSLEMVSSPEGLRRSVTAFNETAIDDRDRLRALLRQSSYWVWNPDDDNFAPSKFAAFEGMSFAQYRREVENGTDPKFDGGRAHRHLSLVTRREFDRRPDLDGRLVAWARKTFDCDMATGLDPSKWRFLELLGVRRYRALLADPTKYRIDDAVRERAEDTWTLPVGEMGPGDRVALWRTASKDGRRGIVALGEVTRGPHDVENVGEDPYWIGPDTASGPRVIDLKYVLPPKVPLWLHEDYDGVLADLTVKDGQGTKAFRIQPFQWWRLMDALGGWPETNEDAEPTSDPQELAARVNRFLAKPLLPKPPGRRYPEKQRQGEREVTKRDPTVIAWVLRRARGVCESCQTPAPFLAADGRPFLEVHHVRWLAKDGTDTPENAVAVCPNCHRHLHHGKDREENTEALYGNVTDLVRE